MTYDELKRFRNEHSTYRPTEENTLKIKLTYSRYANGLEYYQEYRYINPIMIEEMQLVKCDRCGIYMDGGRLNQCSNKHYCYACHKEKTLEECFRLMDERGL